MKNKTKILSLVFVLVLMLIFAISINAEDLTPVETWDVSKYNDGSVYAYLMDNDENPGYFTLKVEGKGEMIDLSYSGEIGWHKYKHRICSATICDGVTTLGEYSFFEHTALKEIYIADSVTRIGVGSFVRCEKLEKVKISNSITAIEDATFYDCVSLKEIAIPSDVTYISGNAFWNCSSLTRVYITNLSSWCKIQFEGSHASPFVNAKELYLNGQLITELVIPDDVTEIKQHSFYSIEGITSVVIGNNVKAIGEGAFIGCINLESVIIGDGVTKIGVSAFNMCKALSTIDFGKNVEIIDDNAFYGCKLLTDLSFAENVKRIGISAFEDCTGLKSVTIGKGVTEIEECAFAGCSLLSKVTLENGIKTIGLLAFGFCESLTELTIPASVESINIAAFALCPIKELKIEDENKSYKVIDNNIYSIDGTVLVQYIGSEDEINFTVPKGVTTIDAGAFAYNATLTEIILPNTVTDTGVGAFVSCYALEKLYIPSSVVTVGEYIVADCPSLTIYCEAISQPESWNSDWNLEEIPVVWGSAMPSSHTYDSGVVTKEPTHLEYGEITYTCTECGDSYTEQIAKLTAHSFGAWTPMENSNQYERKCTCGLKEYMTIENKDDKVEAKPSVDNVQKETEKDESGNEKEKVKIDVVLNIPTANSVAVEIAKDIIEEINGNETEITTDIGNIILDAISMNKLGTIEGSVSVGIEEITTEKEAKNGKMVFSITVNDEDGNPILPPEESDNNGTVTLSFKYHKGLAKEQIKIAYRDENGKLEHMEVEDYDSKTGEVTFKTNHLSDYEIYVEEADIFSSIIKFKGYSTNKNGDKLCAGYEVNYEAWALYEQITEKTLELGFVFTSYERLNGNTPLASNTAEINEIEDCVVIKDSISKSNYVSYEFVLDGITSEYYDHPFVISMYVFDGSKVQYVQENELIDNVTGVSRNTLYTI